MWRSEPKTPVASTRTIASSRSISSGSGRSSTRTSPGAWKVTACMEPHATTRGCAPAGRFATTVPRRDRRVLLARWPDRDAERAHARALGPGLAARRPAVRPARAGDGPLRAARWIPDSPGDRGDPGPGADPAPARERARRPARAERRAARGVARRAL